MSDILDPMCKSFSKSLCVCQVITQDAKSSLMEKHSCLLITIIWDQHLKTGGKTEI